jgi:hypothetical protein
LIGDNDAVEDIKTPKSQANLTKVIDNQEE